MRRLGLSALPALLWPLWWAGPAHAAPSPVPSPVLEGRTLRLTNGERTLWARTYPAVAGDLTGPLEVGGVTYLGTGPAVYALGAGGEVLGRADLPSFVTSLEASGPAVRVGSRVAGYSELFTLSREGGLHVQERAVPPPDPAVTGWLARVADAVPPAGLTRAAQDDPTNPFLALRQARAPGGDPYLRLSAVRRALNTTLPFPAWVQLAARLDAAGFPSAADLALERARSDAAGRGLDPEVPVSRAALGAYGNPSGYVGTLLAQNRLARADVWMRHLRRLHPRFEGGPALYARYAALLDTQGRAGEAEDWRQFARELRGGTLYNLGLDGTHSVRDAARLSALALLLALLAALLTLHARAWRRQGEDLRAWGRWRSWVRHPLSRARRTAAAYASAPERLTLTLLAGALFAALGGWQWSNQARANLAAPAVTTGTYGGGWAGAFLDDLDLRPGPDAALLAGLGAQLDGNAGAAREQYTRALPDACALNNLGVIAQAREDEPQAREHYRAALAARPDLSAAAFNLGLSPGAPELDFQRAYRPGQPRLCYPDQRSLTRALTGDLSATLSRNLREPLALLRPAAHGGEDETAPGHRARLGWAVLGALLWAALLALSVLLPRAATSAQLGRPAAYRALAFSLPGTALLDSAWGGVLLLAWAGSAAALLASAGLPGLDFPHLALGGVGARASLLILLGATYGVNTAVLLAAEVRHARRARREARA